MRVKGKDILRKAILRSLRKQGYSVRDGRIALPDDATKDDLRGLNELACKKKREEARSKLARYEDELLKRIAHGADVLPEAIEPKLIEIAADSRDELLFRYLCLHWSIPVSSGYGRRLRFLLVDQSNDKVIGLLGLGDPVYSLGARDRWIGWDTAGKKERLYHVMDAFVLGAVPPYTRLLCGKLMALMTMTDTVRSAFRNRYGGREAVISGQVRKPYLAMVTTTSALGRSSLYNRLRLDGRDYWHRIGTTSGWGEFHFSNGVYADIRAYADRWCEATAKKESWGDGFRNKREVIRKVLSRIGLSTDLGNHGIEREIYAAPLGEDTLPFLRGESKRPLFYKLTEQTVWETFRDRWLLPRAARCPDYRTFDARTYRLWPEAVRRVP